MNLNALRGLVDNLESAIQRLRWEPEHSAWADYEQTHTYSDSAWSDKRRLTEAFLDEVTSDAANPVCRSGCIHANPYLIGPGSYFSRSVYR